MRKKRNSKKLRASALSILLAGSMMLGMVPGGMGQVYAADADTPVKEEQTGFLDKAKDFFSDMGEGIADLFAGDTAEAEPAAALDKTTVADEPTFDTWEGIVNMTTANVGRIWTDKTVSKDKVTLPASSTGDAIDIEKGKYEREDGTTTESDFLVGLSALGSTSSIQGETKVPLDTVFVLDFSGSMANPVEGSRGDARCEAMVEAVNGAIRTLMDSNADNRVAVVAFSDGSSTILTNLAHYDVENEHLSITESWIWGFSVTGKNSSRSVTGGTNIHQGIYDGMDILASNTDTTIEVNGQEIKRIPSVVLLSDGAPTFSSSSQSWWEPNGSYQQGPGGDSYAGNGFLAALTASYMKNRIDSNYGTTDQTKTQVYTVGLGVDNLGTTDRSLAQVTLNPTEFIDANTDMASTFSGYWDTYESGRNVDVVVDEDRQGQEETYTVRHPNDDYNPTSILYNDKYFSANNADDLSQAFQDIATNIVQSAPTSPITSDGEGGAPEGYITFTDELGAYMQVDGFNSIVYADHHVANPEVNADKTKYTFQGVFGGNGVYEEADLSEIEITVERSADLAKGDVVTVKIPATTLPLRTYNVKTDTEGNSELTISEQFPIRVFFDVSLKDGVKETLMNGLDKTDAADQALKAYLEKNNATTEDGKKAASFYSNLYTGGTEGVTLGNTIAEFKPAPTNSFYYFTERTPVYTEENVNSPLTEEPDMSGNTYYYYQKTYWGKDESGKVTNDLHEWIRVNGANFNQDVFNGELVDGRFYIKAGAPRMTRIADKTMSKNPNTTGTASEVINPQWDSNVNPQNIQVHLGNNGKLNVELPGALEITKNATVAEGKNLNEPEIVKEKEFEFALNMPTMAGKTVAAEKRNAQDVVQGSPFKLVFDENGNAAVVGENDATSPILLKDEETLYIHGLNADATYTVTEKADKIPDGFELTSVDGDSQKTEATGTIQTGVAQSHTFVNTYDVDPVVVGDDETFINFEKTFNRWDLADSFEIMLAAADKQNPMPDGAADGVLRTEVKKTDSITQEGTVEGKFGKVTYTAPGEYVYNVVEAAPEAKVPGVNYSLATYRVTVKVSDNGHGQLVVDSVEMVKVQNDDGVPMEESVATAEFVNNFAAGESRLAALSFKQYTDTTGKAMTAGQFKFKMTPRTDLEPEGNNDARPELPEEITPDENGSIVVDCTAGGFINFGNAIFKDSCVGNTYVYQLEEVVPDGVTPENPTLNGMTYDTNKYLVRFTVTAEEIDGITGVKVESAYTELNENGSESSVEGTYAPIPTFVNTYDPEDAVLPGEGQDAVKGGKTLKGRNSLADETYTFKMTAANAAATEGLANDWIQFMDAEKGEFDTAKTELTKAVSDLTNGVEKEFAFDSIKFTRPGHYRFNVNEIVDAPKLGMVYDTHTASVIVDVAEEQDDAGNNTGKLIATVTYDNGTGKDTTKAAFVNTYSADMTYRDDVSLNLTKRLTGRDQKAGEFEFTIEGIDKDGSVSATDAEAKLAGTDRTFNTIADAKDGNVSFIFNKMSGITFDETNAGQIFSYRVEETPGNLPGVAYDNASYDVDIQVVDNGDGSMHTVTTVTKNKEDGTTEEPVIYDGSDRRDEIVLAFANTYTAKETTFATTDLGFTKELVGRDWADTDTFEFTMTATNEGPLPKDTEGNDVTTVVVSKPESDNKTGFDFGTITFDKAGTYTYVVHETNEAQTINGITYDSAFATITIDVTDLDEDGNPTGQLAATVRSNTHKDFVNTYRAGITHNAAGGIITEKTLTGHAMAEKQFEFQVEALAGRETTAEENAQRIGIEEGVTETYKNPTAANDGETVQMKTADGDDLQFTSEDIGKTFKYKFSEVDGKQAGYTYDKTEYTVELWVTDDGDGTLTLHTMVNGENEVLSDETNAVPTVLEFNNSYAASGVLKGATDLAGIKEMNGPWGATGKDLSGFQFTIEGGDNTTKAAIVDGTVVLPENVTVTSGEQGNFNFGDITFNKKGTYTFTVSEVVPADEDKVPGVSYNADPVTITVNVTDNNDGTLSATLVEGSPELIFTNTYATTGNATFTPSVVKEVKGLDAKENFTFRLSAADEATRAAIDAEEITGIGKSDVGYSSDKKTTDIIVKDGSQTVNFDQLTFTKAGTYKFTVEETNKNEPAGWTYDSHTYEITINVTDVDSVLKATQAINENPMTNSGVFTNSFAATTTYGEEGGLNVTKTLNGRTLAADMFDFTITGVGTDTVTAEDANAKLVDDDKSFKNSAPATDGVAVMSKLGAVKFDETDIGKTYQYAVSETAGQDTHYTYDQVTATVAIQVLENNGELYTVTTVTKGDDDQVYNSMNGNATAVVPFVNSYTPDIVTVEPGRFAGNVTKVLKGNRDTALAADEFNFQMTITAAEGSSMDNVVLPGGATDGTITAANKADGSVSFGNIQFKAAGNYHVAISEVIPESVDPNMTYDGHTFSYDIAVTYDAEEGTLSAAVVEGSTEGSAIFTNIYEADDAKDVVKTDDSTTSVNGKVVGVGDQLTYTIDWVNNAVDETTGAPTKAEVTITDVVPKGTKFVSVENEGAYNEETNTITWTLGEQEAGASGTVSFVVEVLNNAGGTGIENQAEITVGDNAPKQTNKVTTNVPGKDSVVEGGGELQVGSVLTYTIDYMNPEVEAATVTITDIIPEGLDYVEGSAGEYAVYDAETRTLTWNIAGVPAGEEGTVTFQGRVNESAVEKVENQAIIQIGENGPTYETNTDEKPIPEDGNLAISKTIELTAGQGTEIDTKKEFEFTVTLADIAGNPLTGEYAYTIENEAGEVAGNEDLKVTNGGTISLKHGEIATVTGLPAGTKYTVTETAAAGYSSTPEGGVINGSVTAEQTAQAAFTNTYSVTGSLSGADDLKVIKNFTGRDGEQWLEGDAFTFTLTAEDEATQNAIDAGFITLPEITELTIDSTMEEKQAAFGDIIFNIAGTFKFNVTEQKSGIAGVTDDNEPVREIVVKVEDNKDGKLTATVVAEESDNLTFKNVYGGATGEGEDIAAQINATKKLTGRDMEAGEFNFEVVTRSVAEDAEGFTAAVVATGTNEAVAEGTEGKVTFVGGDINGAVALKYTTESLNKAVADGYATKVGNVWTVNYTAKEKTEGLRDGVTAVEGKTSFDFTIVVTDNTNGTLTAEVQYPEDGIAFENRYATGGTTVNTDPTDTTALFEKVLAGRDWLDTDAFTFKIEPQDGAPAPVDAEGNTVTEVTVTKADVKNGKAPFGFGTIHFTDEHMGTASTKEFNYRVTEADLDAAAMPGVSKDTHAATLSITLTDDGEGTLSAATPNVKGGTFTNTYKSELDYNAVGGLQISKVLNGRDMQNDQFTFNVTPKATEGSTTAEEAAQKLGFAEVKAYEFKNEAADMGETTYINVLAGKEVVFTQADAGKTYTYEIAEVKGENDAYTYDEAVNIVTISVVDQNNGTMTVTTTVTKNGAVIDTKTVNTGDEAAAPATAPFVNVYNDKEVSLGGDGEVSINATKSLTNRPMADKEFIFNVTDQNGTVVATGDNDVSGKITFTPIEYTTDKLNADAEAKTAIKSYDAESDAYTYTYQYTVTEDLENVDEGVTGIATTFSIKVIVTDDGQGTLQIAVVYPDGKDLLPFKNAYGADENGNVEINVNGQKVLNVESGDNAPDITGSYNFTLSGSDGAPMPEKTTAVNDAAGNVDFGEITYTMENVFGDTGSAKETAKAETENTETEGTETETETGAGIVGTENAETEIMPISEKRTKTFTYTVTEAGSVEGVVNDPESVKTFNVTVTDNGDGTLKVDKDYTGFEFAFTNTYRVDPIDVDINDAETGITVKKELTGRAMNAGEFVFELISEKDKSIREAVNDAEGNVKFETMNFTAPGVYTYTLRERNTNLGGVEYDTAEYEVVVTVTDNGNGTMSAEAKLADDGREVVFENHYEAAPTSVMFGASKIYKGADLKDGQFTFVVKDAEGKVVSEATNNKDGMVAFETMEFDKEGTYTFTISEKNDKQKNVTYDKTEYTVTVQITDNLNGQLEAEVIYEDEKAPVFTNKYTKPAEPQKPEEPKTPGTVQTGDNTPIVGLVVAMVVALAAIVAVAVILFKRRRR